MFVGDAVHRTKAICVMYWLMLIYNCFVFTCRASAINSTHSLAIVMSDLHPASRNFLLLAQFWHTLQKTLHESSKIFVENVWYVARIYFQTQAYTIVIAMHCSGHSKDHQFINNRCSQLKNKGCCRGEKTRFLSLEVQVVVTSKAVWDLCKDFLFSSSLKERKWGWVICCLLIVIFHQFLKTIVLE